MNIIYVKGNLFDAPKGSILIHACNTQGVWGGGIARQFAALFPNSYKAYQALCHERGNDLLGTCLIIRNDNEYDIACLFTSKGYGKNTDYSSQIIMATKSAIDDLINHNKDNKEFHACKINSGLFRVPWELTEEILSETGKQFTVYEY